MTRKHDANRGGTIDYRQMTDSRVEQLRIPPQSIEAEQAVLGGLMLAPDAWTKVADRLTEADFYRRDHQLIYRAIRELHGKGHPYDAVTLGEWFESNGFSEMVSGGAYLIDLASTTPSAANIAAYAEIVREKGMLRRLIDLGTKIVNAGFQPEGRDSLEVIGEAQSDLGTLLTDVPCELEHIAPVLAGYYDELTQRYQRGGEIQGLSLGMGTELDELTNGLTPGLHVLAARPKMGKTTLAMNICEHVSVKQGKTVALFPLEMRQRMMAERLIASYGVSGNRLRRGNLDEQDWAKTSAAVRELRNAPIYMARPQNVRVEHIVAQVKRLHAKEPVSLVVIDYLQLIQTDGDNRAQALGEVTRALVMLAQELGIAILLLSQLNRTLDSRTDKRPMPSDLRDSGAIEQDADSVSFIYRDEVYNKSSPDAGTAEFIVALQRSGPPGMVRLSYAPETFRFSKLSYDWAPVRSYEQRATKRRSYGADPASAAAGGDR